MMKSTSLKARNQRQKVLPYGSNIPATKLKRTNQNKSSKLRQKKKKSSCCVFLVLVALLGMTCLIRIKLFSKVHHDKSPTPLAKAIPQEKVTTKPFFRSASSNDFRGDNENIEMENEESREYPSNNYGDGSKDAEKGNDTENSPKEDFNLLEDLIDNFQSNFEARYGTASMKYFENALKPFGSLDITAQRLISKKEKSEPFVMAFAGYSVTVGRGNFFNQSYPFVMKNILEPIFEKLGLELVVRNAAIGGIPSFPYAFCFPHFLGTDADVISWDYSMNEGKGSDILESYIRLSQKNLPNRPMLVVLDNNEQRQTLLQKYAASISDGSDKIQPPVLLDGVILHRAGDFLPNLIIEEKETDGKPPGFQNWNEFGAPSGCPGKSSWHPKQQEHSLLGHILAKHFVEVVKRSMEFMKKGKNSGLKIPELKYLPPPRSTLTNNALEISQLLYGHEIEDSNGNNNDHNWKLHNLSCRTSFLPAQDHEKVLPSIVVQGLNTQSSKNIMQARPNSMYKDGWVLDVSEIERKTKKKVENCGGLGYIDMKIALYGIPESGKLTLWLPYEGGSTSLLEGEDASNQIHNLILCEANEKREDSACRLNRDLQLNVGGVDNPSITMVNGAGVYLKRPTCVSVEVPPAATLVSLSSLTPNHGINNVKGDTLGLLLEIQAASNVTRKMGACCISHVVWEQS